MDLVVEALARLVERPVERRELTRPPGRTLRWIETGEGPTVVLVAGSGGTCLDWAPVLPGLAERYRVVAYDRAGSGASDPAPALDITTQTDDLAALLAATGPAVVVGHSWGGLLAQMSASDSPEWTHGLVLVDASHEDVMTAAPWPLLLAERAIGSVAVAAFRLGLFGRLAASAGRRLAEVSTEDPAVRELLAGAYVASYSTRSQVAMIRDESRMADRGVPELRRWRATHSLPDVPLLALSAAKAPEKLRGLSTAATTAVCASVSRGTQIVVPGAGHYIHHDRPDAVVSAVVDVASAAP